MAGRSRGSSRRGKPHSYAAAECTEYTITLLIQRSAVLRVISTASGLFSCFTASPLDRPPSPSQRPCRPCPRPSARRRTPPRRPGCASKPPGSAPTGPSGAALILPHLSPPSPPLSQVTARLPHAIDPQPQPSFRRAPDVARLAAQLDADRLAGAIGAPGGGAAAPRPQLSICTSPPASVTLCPLIERCASSTPPAFRRGRAERGPGRGALALRPRARRGAPADGRGAAGGGSAARGRPRARQGARLVSLFSLLSFSYPSREMRVPEACCAEFSVAGGGGGEAERGRASRWGNCALGEI